MIRVYIVEYYYKDNFVKYNFYKFFKFKFCILVVFKLNLFDYIILVNY